MSEQPDSSHQPKPLNIFFRMVIAACGLFVLTIFIMIAMMLSDTKTSLTNFLDNHGGTVIGCEVLVIIVLSIIALKFDRSPILRNLDQFENRYDEAADNDVATNQQQQISKDESLSLRERLGEGENVDEE